MPEGTATGQFPPVYCCMGGTLYDLVQQRFAGGKGGSILRANHTHRIDSFPRIHTYVGRDDDVLQREERIICCDRLMLHHVHCSSGEMAVDQRLIQRRFIDNAAAVGSAEQGRRLN